MTKQIVFFRRTAQNAFFVPVGIFVLLFLQNFEAVRGDNPAGSEKSRSDLVEICTLDPTIQIELPYATTNNFCKTKLYPIERCFLRREVAEKLVAAHHSLAKHGLGIKVWDGYRPNSVQWKMWEVSPKKGYVGDPKRGSKHNRGAAVDVTLFNLDDKSEVKMPTPYDEFTPRAHARYLKLNAEVAGNRDLLQKTMLKFGFKTIQTEWWHFDFVEWEKFPLENIPIEVLAADADNAKNLPGELDQKYSTLTN